ncbi:MAG: tetratricopeptide repeat protein [Planctomycetes bacterium]|jgi:tetratricopeptide (TPR) repeat protein|nr:tetratricopeptide repeat protein [Planctomycetota bacterium]
MATDQLDQLRQQAQEAISRGQFQDARNIYQQALGYRSDSPEIHYGIATACFLLGDLHSAVYHFKEVIRIDPLRAGAYVNLGAVQNRLGHLDDAVATLLRAIQLDPKNAAGYYNLGLVYRQLSKTEMAINAYREAVRFNDRMYDAHYNLGNIFLEKGQHALAIVHYRSALEIRPDWQKGRNALAVALAGQKAQEAGGGENPTNEAPSTTTTLESQIDPDRVVDPNFHGKLLREIHEIVVETDNKSQVLLEFLQKQVEEAIRELSICMLTPKDPKYNLTDQIRKFDEVMAQLQQHRDGMQKRVLRAKLLSEQVFKI